MSRFIDKLTHQRQAEPQRIGFMMAAASAEKLRMQLIACLTAENLAELSKGLSPADAVMVEITKADDIEALEKVCQVKDGVPGGGWLRATRAGTLNKAVEAACDYWVFPTSAPLTLTQKDKAGRVLELDASLSEGLLRTANDLPVDGVLLGGKEDEITLTISRLMFVQRVIYMVNKPVLVAVPDSLTRNDLQALWDMGVAGVVFEITDKKTLDKFADLRQAIDKLGPPAFRKKSKASAILPRLQPEAAPPPEQEEEEEEE